MLLLLLQRSSASLLLHLCSSPSSIVTSPTGAFPLLLCSPACSLFLSYFSACFCISPASLLLHSHFSSNSSSLMLRSYCSLFALPLRLHLSPPPSSTTTLLPLPLLPLQPSLLLLPEPLSLSLCLLSISFARFPLASAAAFHFPLPSPCATCFSVRPFTFQLMRPNEVACPVGSRRDKPRPIRATQDRVEIDQIGFSPSPSLLSFSLSTAGAKEF